MRIIFSLFSITVALISGSELPSSLVVSRDDGRGEAEDDTSTLYENDSASLLDSCAGENDGNEGIRA